MNSGELRKKHGIANYIDMKATSDPCGDLRVLYNNSPNLSVAHADVTRDAEPHMHKIMEELYYVLSGRGEVAIGDDVITISYGDLVPIPRSTWHWLIRHQDGTISSYHRWPFQVLAITHPRFMPEDMIFRDGTTLASRTAATPSR